MPQNRNGHRHKAVHQKKASPPLGLLGAGALAIALVAAIALLVAGGDSAPSPSGNAGAEPTWDTSTSDGPRLDVDRTVHDEGSVPYEHAVNAAFRVKNTGSAALTLGKPTVKTIEGC
jgi:hypothetical protein